VCVDLGGSRTGGGAGEQVPGVTRVGARLSKGRASRVEEVWHAEADLAGLVANLTSGQVVEPGERVKRDGERMERGQQKDQTRRVHMHAHAARMVSISVEPATSVSLSALDDRGRRASFSHDFSPTAPVCTRRIGLEAIRHLA
jgi:hypothetical protein